MTGFREAGVNRISMGVQSFSERKLKFLGRVHSSKDIPLAVGNIKKAGFENFNLDLIYGIDGETEKELAYDLGSVFSLEPTHISAYTLTIEPGTEFGKRKKKGLLPILDSEIQADFYYLSLIHI